VRFHLDAIPANDNFADAPEVTGSTWQVSADNRYATEEGEFFLSGWRIGTLWWKWTAPFSGEARLSVHGSEGEVYAWMGTGSLTNLQVLQGTMPGMPRGPVQAGVTYWICAATAHGRGRIKLTLFSPNPPNDAYAARLALTNLPVRLFASTIGATNELHEPKVSGSRQPGSVWWKWVAPASGRLIVKATQVSQPWWFSLNVSVFTGRDFRHLKLLATQAQEVSLPVKAGQEYAIAVSGGTHADFFLEARLVPPPANDAFENRQPLAGARAIALGDNTGATRQSGEPRLARNASGASLWYSWTAPADGWCTMSVTSSNGVAASLVVLKGKSLKSLKRLVPAESELGRISFQAHAGVTYEILLDSYDNQRGALELNVVLTTIRIVSPPAGSVVSAAEPVTFTLAADPQIDAVVTNVTLLAGRENWDAINIADANILTSTLVASNLPTGEVTLRVRLKLDSGEERLSPPLTLTVRPANDNFALARVMTGYEWSAAPEFEAATWERGEPSHVPGWKRYPSLWWAWTAPSSGETVVTIRTYGRNRIGLGLYTGENLAALTRAPGRVEVDTFEGEARFYFQAQRGVTYRFATVTDPRSARSGFVGSLRCLLKASALIATSPMDVAGPASISFALETSEALELISSVDFFANETPVAALPAPPFAFTLTNLSCGTFDISARINKISGEPAPLVAPIRFWVRPSNDHFTNRIVLTGHSNRLAQCISTATLEPAEPIHVGPWPQASVWWSWTAPESGKLYIGESYPPYPVFPYPYVALYTGDVLTNLSLVTNSAPERTYPEHIVLRVQGGTTYQVVAGGKELDLRMRLYAPPVNDHFSNSIALSGTTGLIVGHTVGATREPGEPMHENQAAENTVWWNWTAPTNGYIVVSPEGPLVAAVYEGTNVTALQARPRLAGREVMVESGRLYSIALVSYWGDTERVSAQFHFTPTVEHDWFASAIHLAGTNEVLSADNRGATREPNEVSLPGGLGKSLWWLWTAPTEGNVYLTAQRIIGTGPLFAVYEGASASPRAPLATGDFYLSANFRALAGHTYTILVDSIGGTSTSVLTLLFVPAPENDAFANATTLTGFPAFGTGTVRGASLETGEGTFHSFDGASVWFRWQSPATTNVIVTAPNHYIAVLTGQTHSSLTRLLPQDHNDTMYFSATAGGVYWIRITQRAGVETDLNHPDFELRVRSFDVSANDLFANATLLTELSGGVSDENWLATLESGEYWAAWQNMKRSLWYRWQSPGAGLLVVTNSAPDSTLGMLTFIGADWRSLAVLGGGFNNATTPVRPGDSVYLVADRRYGEGGLIAFGYQFLPAPANDEATNAFELVGVQVTFGGDVHTATGESTVISDRHRFDYRDVWWRWTAPATGAVIITNIAASGLPLIRVYTGTPSERVLIAHNHIGLDDRAVTFNAAPGETYLILVSWSSDGDQVLLRLESEIDASSPLVFSPSAQVTLTLPVLGAPGMPFTIDSSTNLVDWEPVFSGTLQQSRFDYPIREVALPQHFFRIRVRER